MYADETLACVDCGRDFIFSSGEQRFYEQKGFQNKPNRCPDCRQARKSMRASNPGGGERSGGGRPREMFTDTNQGKYREPQCGESPGYLPGSLYGASATGEPANSFFPSGSVTSRPLARKALSLA